MNQATSSPTLYLAFELGQKQWRLGFTVGLGQPPRERTIPAGNLTALQREIALARKRYQPESALSQWYWQRFGNGSKRQRKIGIVALARKLLIALWRYLTCPGRATLIGKHILRHQSLVQSLQYLFWRSAGFILPRIQSCATNRWYSPSSSSSE
jgi:hypothetical protein